MPAEVKKEIELEIAHVLFIDIVGYSKLSINEQRAAIDELNQVVRSSEQFQKAEAAGPINQNPNRRRHGTGFLQEPGRASAMRLGDQPRPQRAPAPASADGHPQRTG